MRVGSFSPERLAALLDTGLPSIASLDVVLPMGACASRHAATVRARSYDYVRRHAGALPRVADALHRAYGFDVPALRGFLSPVDTFAAGLSADALLSVMQVLDEAARDAHLDTLVGFVAACTDADAVRLLPAVLARTERLDAELDVAHLADATPQGVGEGLTACAPHRTRLRLSAGMPPLPTAAAPRLAIILRADLPLDVPPERLARTMAGLGRAGALLTTYAAHLAQQTTGYPLEAGSVYVDLSATEGAELSEPGALAALRRASMAVHAGARMSSARATFVLAADSQPSRLASVVASGRYVLPSVPSASSLSDLSAVCASTGHAARLTFAP